MMPLNSRFRLLAILATAWFTVLVTSRNSPAQQTSPDYFRSAVAVERWLQDFEVRTESGLSWPIAPAVAKDANIALYHGNSGAILFLLALRDATTDASEKERLLEDAKAAADQMIAQLPAVDSSASADCGLYTGLAGVGFTLGQVADATVEQEYEDAAKQCLAIIKQSAGTPSDSADRAEVTGVRWNNSTDIISGTAGIGLYLLHAAQEFGDQEALQLAAQAGDGLLAATQQTEHGLSWKMNADSPRDMPNFSHGTAGIAFFLCQLSRATGEDKYLQAAIGGANHLIAIAKTSDEGMCIFHHTPGGEDLYYLGWCHGPPGTARLFFALEQATGDDNWRHQVQAAAQSILSSGIPQQRTAGFWNNHGACCGTAGVAEFFLELGLAYDEPKYLEFARELTTSLLDNAVVTEIDDQQRLSWEHAEHRVQPENLSAQTGYMQGSAGIGILLLRMDAVAKTRLQPERLPDSPYGQ